MNEKDQKLWENYVEAYMAFGYARRAFFLGAEDKLGIIKSAIFGPDQDAAFMFLKMGNSHEIQHLFGELLLIASSQQVMTGAAQDLIFSLPHEWLLENIEIYAEPILARDDAEQFRNLIYIHADISLDLAEKLANRAVENHNLYIQDAGKRFLAGLPRRREEQAKN